MSRPDRPLDVDAWESSPIPPPPPPAPVGPIGARVLQHIDEGLIPTVDTPPELRDQARVLALAAVVEAPHNETVGRAAAQLLAASRGGAPSAVNIRERVELLLTPTPHRVCGDLPMPDADEHRFRALAAALDIVAAVLMSDQRNAASREQWPAMESTAYALAGVADEMARQLDESDAHAGSVGWAIERHLRHADWAIRDEVELSLSWAIRNEVERAGGLQ